MSDDRKQTSITITITSTNPTPFTNYCSLFTPVSLTLAPNFQQGEFSTTVADILDKFRVQSVRYLGFRGMVVA